MALHFQYCRETIRKEIPYEAQFLQRWDAAEELLEDGHCPCRLVHIVLFLSGDENSQRMEPRDMASQRCKWKHRREREISKV
jgi:hypothetical protein